jgi:hypothetical protein
MICKYRTSSHLLTDMSLSIVEHSSSASHYLTHLFIWQWGHGPGVVRGPRLGVETRRLAAGTGRVVTTRAGMSVGLDVGVAVFPTVLVAPHFIITVMRRVAVTPRGRPPARAAARQRTMSVAVAAGTGASVLRHLRALVRDVNSVAGVTATAAAASAGGGTGGFSRGHSGGGWSGGGGMNSDQFGGGSSIVVAYGVGFSGDFLQL